MTWNAPSFALADDFATFHLRGKSGVQLILHFGVRPRPDVTLHETIEEPDARLEWKSADRAVMSFVDLADVEARAASLTRVVRAWLKAM